MRTLQLALLCLLPIAAAATPAQEYRGCLVSSATSLLHDHVPVSESLAAETLQFIRDEGLCGDKRAQLSDFQVRNVESAVMEQAPVLAANTNWIVCLEKAVEKMARKSIESAETIAEAAPASCGVEWSAVISAHERLDEQLPAHLRGFDRGQLLQSHLRSIRPQLLKRAIDARMK